MPFVSVIIPTRERCETLRSALKTVCSQDFTDAEFIVSDNVSEDDTAAIVAGFNDPRVRYIRTPKRLSMTGNFSFALSHARGTYVTILGDDDGLIPGALSVLAQWARATGADAISWQEATYYWPTHSLPERRGRLQIPLLNVNWNVSARAAFTASKWSMLRWNYLPIIYGGLVKLDVMNKIRTGPANTYYRIFQMSIPLWQFAALSSDTFTQNTHFRLLDFQEKAWHQPTNRFGQLEQRIPWMTYNLIRFLQENTIAPHPDFPVGDLLLENAGMIDCLHRVKDALFDGRLFIPDSVWLYRLLKEANSAKEPLRSELILRLNEIAAQRGRRWLMHSLLRIFRVKQALEHSDIPKWTDG